MSLTLSMTKGKPNFNSSIMLLTSDVTPSSKRHTANDRNPFTFSKTSSNGVTIVTRGGQSLVSRRPRCQTLSPLQIPGQERGSERERDEVEDGARQLFSNFVHREAQTKEAEAAARQGIITPEGYGNARVAMVGRELRHMADKFARTAERRQVKLKAQQVKTNISRGEFKDLLREFFASGGITRERIVVLFFFCTDVALRAKNGSWDVCSQFLAWSMNFIAESVCDWVRSHGGWGKVMKAPFSSLSASLMAVGVIIFGVGVIRYYVTRP